MLNFLSAFWDFIVWLFPWILLGLGSSVALQNIHDSGNLSRKKEVLNASFVSLALGVVVGLVAPIYLKPSIYWMMPLIFWGGTIAFYGILGLFQGDFGIGLFGLGMSSITQYIISISAQSNLILIFLLRLLFLIYIFIALFAFPRYLQDVLIQKRTKKKKQSKPILNDDVDVPVSGKEIVINPEKSLQRFFEISSAILGIILVILQLVNQALDILKKIP